MCSHQSVWGSLADRRGGHGLRLEALASDTSGDSWEAFGDTRVQPLWSGAAAKPCWSRQGRCWKWLCQLLCPCLCWFCRDPSHGLGWRSTASSPCPDTRGPREVSVPSPDTSSQCTLFAGVKDSFHSVRRSKPAQLPRQAPGREGVWSSHPPPDSQLRPSQRRPHGPRARLPPRLP